MSGKIIAITISCLFVLTALDNALAGSVDLDPAHRSAKGTKGQPSFADILHVDFLEERRLPKETASSSDSPKLVFTESGHIWVVSEDNRTGNKGIYFNGSTDNGRTWFSNDIRVDRAEESNEAAFSADVEGVVIKDHRGFLAAYDRVIYMQNSVPNIWFQHSSDNGQTWQTNSTKLNTDAPEPQLLFARS